MSNVLGYAKNNWPSEFLDWPDAPANRTSSLAMQFGVSTRNPMNVLSGYMEAPYQSQEYLDLGDWGAGFFFTQITTTFNNDAGVRSQFNTVINNSKTLLSQIFINIEKQTTGGMQFLARIDETSPFGNQYLNFVDTDSGIRDQFTVAPDSDRILRTQYWGLVYQENPVKTQFFMDNPYSIIADGDYCKVQWPSYAWPYIYVTQKTLRMEFTVAPVDREPLFTQFNVSSSNKSRLKTQVYVSPIGIHRLNTSYYAPLALVIENGRPQFNMQWRFAAASRTHFEVRWRPF